MRTRKVSRETTAGVVRIAMLACNAFGTKQQRRNRITAVSTCRRQTLEDFLVNRELSTRCKYYVPIDKDSS